MFIATPTLDGQLCMEYATAMLKLGIWYAAEYGDKPFCHMPLRGCSNLAAARNGLVRAFLATECEYLLWIDSDIAWTPQHAILLYRKAVYDGHGVVALDYRRKIDAAPDRPEAWASGNAPADGGRFVEHVAGGFTLVRRSVYEGMTDPWYAFADDLSEDFWFSEELYRQTGQRPFLMPSGDSDGLYHIGIKGY